MSEFISVHILLGACAVSLQDCLTRKSMTHNKQMMINKAAPPTDPAMIGMTDPVLELLSAEFPIWIKKQK